MPIISQFYGILIYIYKEINGRHNIPHFHAKYAEFEAVYERDNLKDIHHEKARFIKKDGKWLYKDGDIVPKTIFRTGPKIGRNDPCPCGSGKKYKHCCALKNTV